jgi:uncharacterized protein DUF1353
MTIRDLHHGDDTAPLLEAKSQVGVESWPLRVERFAHTMRMQKGIQLLVLVNLLTALAAYASEPEPTDTPEAEAAAPAAEYKWGYYDGDPVTKWNPDGRTMTLLTELRYTDPQGNVWVAPIGSVVDGASIPRYLWSIMGGPFEGKYRNASVLHDVAYGEHNRPWQDCDRMFYYAMRCSGVSGAEAKTMFYALYRFGHHWKFPIKRAKPVKYEGKLVARGEEIPRAIPVNPEEVKQARDWISDTDPTLEQIEQRANSEDQTAPTPEQTAEPTNVEQHADSTPEQTAEPATPAEH